MRNDGKFLVVGSNADMEGVTGSGGPHVAVSASFVPPIGEERYQKSMRVKTALDLGIHVGQGSDWLTLNPTPNPFIAIEGMVTRENVFSFDPALAGKVNPADAIESHHSSHSRILERVC